MALFALLTAGACRIAPARSAALSENKSIYIDSMTILLPADVRAIPARNEDGTVNAIIEIPAGTRAKWELCKNAPDRLVWEQKDGLPRVINYLGYPANYGTIPGTALPLAKGGDGDPLDVVVLGDWIERGSLCRVRVIGLLGLIDNGEVDHKLVAVPADDALYRGVTEIAQVESRFVGLLDILALWFTNYKGTNTRMEVTGYFNRDSAHAVLAMGLLGTD